MKKTLIAIALAIAVVTGIALAAQTTVTTSGPATGSFAVYQHASADCATGAGTTCNVIFTIVQGFNNPASFVCDATLSGGTPASGPVLNTWNIGGGQVQVFLTNGVTSTTYAVTLVCPMGF